MPDDRGMHGRHGASAVPNHDILLHILGFLSDPRPEVRARDLPARAALARCARVSHALSDPALRLLWSTLYSPLPLWLLLGPDRTDSHHPAADGQLEPLQTVRRLQCLLFTMTALFQSLTPN